MAGWLVASNWIKRLGARSWVRLFGWIAVAFALVQVVLQWLGWHGYRPPTRVYCGLGYLNLTWYRQGRRTVVVSQGLWRQCVEVDLVWWWWSRG